MLQKAAQEADVPTKIVKENADIFADFVFQILKYDCYIHFSSCL